MTRIILDNAELDKKTVSILGQDSAHVCLSLRMRQGETLTVCDGKGKDALCVIDKTTPERTDCTILEIKPSPAELCSRVFIYQCLPKGDKLEFILQKTTELGVCGIVPVLSDRCISRPDERSFAKKLKRYRDICKEAAQQCGRGVIPTVSDLVDFKTAVSSLPDNAVNIFCYEKERDRTLRSVLSSARGDINVFIGAEGGFSDNEKELADKNGLIFVTFGQRILRCETAPVYVMSAVSYELS